MYDLVRPVILSDAFLAPYGVIRSNWSYLLQVSSENLVVWDSAGREVESQLVPLSNISLLTTYYHIKAYLGISASSSARYWLAFSASVPPLGFSTYVVSSAKRAGRNG